MKILVCGFCGQLGSDCMHVLRRVYGVVGLGPGDMDVSDGVVVDRVIRDLGPDVIVNCAAYSNVDACETEREEARKVNVDGPKNLAYAVKKHGGRLIHISTDYVFDGRKRFPEPYLENDEPNPLSHYGRLKLEGEIAVRQVTDSHVILRTAWLYGANGRNFLKTILKLALKDSQKEITVVNDQYGSPTWSYRLAEQIARLIEVNARGTYHATSEGYCTWYELARCFLEKMGIAHRLIPCTTEEYPTPAARPKNSILENQRLKAEGINLMPFWKNDVSQFASEFGKRLIEGRSW